LATVQGIKCPSNSIPIYILNTSVTKNKDQFLSNSQVHKINTRQPSSLYLPTANVAMYQKIFYYSGIKIYNHLPKAIKDLSGDKNKFKLPLKRYLFHNSFFGLEEYFNTQLTMILILFRLLLMLILIILLMLTVNAATPWYYNKAQLMLNVHLLYSLS
jgi:hypothetical protein